MRISDWSSDVCSSDLTAKAYARLSGSRSIAVPLRPGRTGCAPRHPLAIRIDSPLRAPATPTARIRGAHGGWHTKNRSEEHTSELQSLMRISYAVFRLKKQTNQRVKQGIEVTRLATAFEIGIEKVIIEVTNTKSLLMHM